jgi:hypothetical protein
MAKKLAILLAAAAAWGLTFQSVRAGEKKGPSDDAASTAALRAEMHRTMASLAEARAAPAKSAVASRAAPLGSSGNGRASASSARQVELPAAADQRSLRLCALSRCQASACNPSSSGPNLSEYLKPLGCL